MALLNQGALNQRGPFVAGFAPRFLGALAGFFALTLTALSAEIRVVSQTVGTDEMLLALAEPEQIAALSHRSREGEFCAVPEEAAQFPQLHEGDAETILRFRPTLVLFSDYSRLELVTQIQRAGIRTLIFDRYAKLHDVYDFLRTLGVELAAAAKAEALISGCESRVAQLAARLDGTTPVRVIAPSTYGLIPGAETTFQDLCDHAGAENVAATTGGWVGHQPVPPERMLTWPVEFVVVTGSDVTTALEPFRKLPSFQSMPAIRDARAVLIEPWMLSCVSHHRVDAYEVLARALHPERVP